MKMRQSIAELERQFVEEAMTDRERQDMLRRQARQRTDVRNRDKRHRSGTLRYVLLIIILLGTAALVTVAMFQVLYIVMA